MQPLSSSRRLVLLSLILAGCADAAGPTTPDPSGGAPAPRTPRPPQSPVSVIGTNPVAASMAPDCPKRCGYALPLGDRTVDGLNEMADVTGRVNTANTPRQIYIWRHGNSIAPRRSFRSDRAPSPHDFSTDLNDYGQIVGVSNDDSVEVCRSTGCIPDLGRAAIWSRTTT